MKRTTAAGHVDNEYVDVSGPTAGTLLIAEDRNMVQEELANTVEGVIPLDGAKNYQLAQLWQALAVSDWAAQESPEDNWWHGIAYGNGVWIAVAMTGTNQVMISTDNGITWTESAAPETNAWQAIAYGDGVWIAVSSDGTNRVMRSINDGASWSAIAASDDGAWASVATDGAGNWVAVATTAGSGGNRVMRSTDDGASWSDVTVAGAVTWGYVAYGNGVWIAAPEDFGVNAIIRSTDDGATWASIGTPGDKDYISITYDPYSDVWICVGSRQGADPTDEIGIRSTDGGLNWSVMVIEGSQFATGSAAQNVFIVIGRAVGAVPGMWLSSNGGVDWAPIDIVGLTGVSAIADGEFAYGRGNWIALHQLEGTDDIIHSSRIVLTG